MQVADEEEWLVVQLQQAKDLGAQAEDQHICGACRLGGKSVCWMRSITSLSVNSGTLLLRRVPWRVGKMERKEAISRGHSTRASRMGEPLDPWKQN